MATEVDLSLGGYDDNAHAKVCHQQDCARCRWAKYRDRWQSEMPWLESQYDMAKKVWGIGCKLCSQAIKLAPSTMSKFPVSRHHFARFEVRCNSVRMDKFRKHALSPAHRTAEKLASDGNPAAVVDLAEDALGFAPTTAEWLAILEHSRAGHYVADVAEAGNKKKAMS